MNTKKRFFIIVLLAVFTAGCYISSYFILKESINPHGRYIKDEIYVKSYNEDCDITLLKDKLYFTKLRASGAIYKGGLYEIGAKGSRLVYDEEKSTLKSNNFEFYPFKNNLITFNSGFSEKSNNTFYKNIIYKLDTKNGSLKEFSQLKDIYYIDSIFTDEDTLYLSAGNKLYASKDGITSNAVFELNKIIFNSDGNNQGCYSVQNDSIVYISRDYNIIEYSFKQNKILLKKKIPKNSLHKKNDFSIYKIGKDIIFENDSDRCEIYNVSKSFKQIFSDNKFARIGSCGYDNKLFIWSFYDGIYVVDTESGESKQIFKDKVNSIALFGDKWVYYTDENYNLSRVTQNGEYSETVFS